MNNLSSYCGLTDARMRASEKDLPVFCPFSKKLSFKARRPLAGRAELLRTEIDEAKMEAIDRNV